MAYEQEDKGAKQEIENFNVTSSAENFRETSEKFFEDAKDILDGNVDKPLKRRASFSNDDVEKKPNLQLVDHNQFVKKPNDHVFIPVEAIHRIQNLGKKPINIMEAQIGSLLRESDIVRYQDIYGRIK